MLSPFAKRGDPYMLVVSMTGVKRGDRVVQIGCAHGGRLAAIAGKVGLSGRAVALVPDEASATRARTGAAQAGVFIEVDVAPLFRLSVEDEAFDLAVVDDTAGLVGTLRPEDRVALIRELARVIRPRGRVVFIGRSLRGGLGALLTRAQSGPPFVASGGANAALEADGFKSVRTLGEREGLVFVEGINSGQLSRREHTKRAQE